MTQTTTKVGADGSESTTIFKPDYGKRKYTLTYTVYENCQRVDYIPPEEGIAPPTYQEVIGMLVIEQARMMREQSALNRKAFKKHLAASKKKERGSNT